MTPKPSCRDCPTCLIIKESETETEYVGTCILGLKVTYPKEILHYSNGDIRGMPVFYRTDRPTINSEK